MKTHFSSIFEFKSPITSFYIEHSRPNHMFATHSMIGYWHVAKPYML